MLGELGKKLEVDAVIVDLRAGFSEISAGLLLDPRVHRIFVSTLSDQSLTGTCHEIEYIGKLAGSSKGYMPKPSVILSMIPHLQDRQGWKKVDNIRMQTEKAFSDFSCRQNSSGKHDDGFRHGGISIYESPFDQELLVLPKDWDGVVSLIRQSKITDEIGDLPIPREQALVGCKSGGGLPIFVNLGKLQICPTVVGSSAHPLK